MEKNNGKKVNLLPILKHEARRNWKELPTEGDSVGIPDPTLKQGFIGDLEKKTKIELEELIMRQDKLLANKAFISKLKDGGERILQRRNELNEALTKVVSQENKLPLPDMTSVEWQWRDPGVASVHTTSKDTLDSDDDDDDEEDPLELLARHSQDVPTKRMNRNTQENKDPADVIRDELNKLNIQDSSQETASNSEEAKDLGKKADAFQDFGQKLLSSLQEKSSGKLKKEPFKPFRPRTQQTLHFSTSTISPSENSTSSPDAPNISKTDPSETKKTHPCFGLDSKPQFQTMRPINLHKSSLWKCQNSATGPLNFQNCRQIKLLSLQEGLEIGNKTLEKLKELELKQAAVGLARYSKTSRDDIAMQEESDGEVTESDGEDG